MIKLIIGMLLFAVAQTIQVPVVKVAGAMKNIMMKGDLSAYADIDTLDKSHLYGLGPVEGLKGEIMILDGSVYTSSKNGNQLLNQKDMVSRAAMLVYCKIEKWKEVNIKVDINSYAELEKAIETAAKENGLDTDIPFAFMIDASPEKASYHVIDWKKGAIHTMDNHKQFAYTSQIAKTKTTLLGFYSIHHQSIFTHHTSYMHIHILDKETKTVGHLDDIQIKGSVTIYLPGI